MKTKHTAGEWTQGVNTSSKEWMQVFCNNKVIAEVKTIHQKGQRESTDFEEEEANAKLIAAAPEMLKALIELPQNTSFAHVKDVATMIEKAANILEIKATNENSTSTLVKPLLLIAHNIRKAIKKATL